MADVIHINYMLLTILKRFNIPLGFGDKTIEKVCRSHDVNTDFFLEIINSFHDKSYFPEQNLKAFSLELIVKYLRNTHDYYMLEKIPEIEGYIEELIQNCVTENKPNLSMLKKFFTDYKQELNEHIKKEDEMVLPYVLEIDKAYKNNTIDKPLYDKIKNYSINDYEDEHENVEDKLFDLKNIIIKYLPPLQNKNLCNTILIELFLLERDLNDHSRIEDTVLVPKVDQMEQELTKMYESDQG
jgi:regulator of cell morphogenesis and NO signaling